MICEFSEPVNLETDPELPADWEFSKIECETPETYELIQNETYPERQFFVQKTFTYGEALIIWFLTLFFIYLITKSIFNFFWKK